MMGAKRTRHESGFSLIYVLSVVVALSVLFSALVYVCRVHVTIARRALNFEQCYVVSRAVAGAVVDGLVLGKSVVSQTRMVDGLQVTIVAQASGSVQTVQIESISSETSDTISFAYDTISHRLDAWQDNGPGISE